MRLALVTVHLKDIKEKMVNTHTHTHTHTHTYTHTHTHMHTHAHTHARVHTHTNGIDNSECSLFQDNLECLKLNAETSSRVKNSLCLSSFLNTPYFVDDKGGTPPPNADVKMNLRSDSFLTYHKLKSYRLFSDKDKRECLGSLHRPRTGGGA